MGTIYNTDPSELIEKAAEELKKLKSIKAPEWAPFVKTGVHKERPPVKSDWWYVRTASILRQIYRFGPIGISKLRTRYGGKKNRGYKTEHFYKGSGNIIRKIMQQLEKEDFVKKDLKSIHKGRMITAKGKKFLDDIAAKISKIIVKKVEEQKKEEKDKGKEAVAKKEEKQEKNIEEKETKQEQKEKPVEKAKETIQKETKPVKKEVPIKN
mgnify:CR=1 FL=1